MMSFRLIGDPEPRYVSLKVARMKDDERYIVLSLTDVDEQMKEHNAAQKNSEKSKFFHNTFLQFGINFKVNAETRTSFQNHFEYSYSLSALFYPIFN